MGRFDNAVVVTGGASGIGEATVRGIVAGETSGGSPPEILTQESEMLLHAGQRTRMP